MAAPADGDFEAVLRAAVRAEATQLGNELSAASTEGALGELDAEARAAIVWKALSAIRRRDAPRVGALGERIARVGAGKLRVPARSGRAKFRIPDIMTETELIEIKNVRRLRMTHQLADFLVHCEETSRRFVLVTRHDTVLDPRLGELIAQGRIEHRHFTGLLSHAGRQFLARLVTDAAAAATGVRAAAGGPGDDRAAEPADGSQPRD